MAGLLAAPALAQEDPYTGESTTTTSTTTAPLPEEVGVCFGLTAFVPGQLVTAAASGHRDGDEVDWSLGGEFVGSDTARDGRSCDDTDDEAAPVIGQPRLQLISASRPAGAVFGQVPEGQVPGNQVPGVGNAVSIIQFRLDDAMTPGVYDLCATGPQLTHCDSITVLSPRSLPAAGNGSGSGSFGRTGASIGLLVAIGVGAILVGLRFRTMARRRLV